MFVYAAVFVGPFLERANQFDVYDFDVNILLDYGFVREEGYFVFRLNDMKIVVWFTERTWCWDVCCEIGMDKFMEWIENAVRQYKDVKAKRGPSSWVDYVG